MKITPAFFSSALKVVATDTEVEHGVDRDAAARSPPVISSSSSWLGSLCLRTPARISCSFSGMPSFS